MTTDDDSIYQAIKKALEKNPDLLDKVVKKLKTVQTSKPVVTKKPR